jgi:hypothetical protein
MKAKNEIFFIGSDLTTLNRGTEIVHPSESTALAAAKKASSLWKRSPPSFSFFLDVIRKKLVFLRCPWTSLQTHLGATRCSLVRRCCCC